MPTNKDIVKNLPKRNELREKLQSLKEEITRLSKEHRELQILTDNLTESVEVIDGIAVHKSEHKNGTTDTFDIRTAGDDHRRSAHVYLNQHTMKDYGVSYTDFAHLTRSPPKEHWGGVGHTKEEAMKLAYDWVVRAQMKTLW